MGKGKRQKGIVETIDQHDRWQASPGCVRLATWDATRIATHVTVGTSVENFWESQALGTPEGRAQMTALRTGLLEILPKGTELSAAPATTFFEGDSDAIIAKAEPVIAKDGRRAWIARD